MGELEIVDSKTENAGIESKFVDTSLATTISSMLGVSVNDFILAICTSTVVNGDEQVSKWVCLDVFVFEKTINFPILQI